MAYRRLPEVIAHHAGTVKVLHTLRPFAVVMAGTRELDPWKDLPMSDFCCHSRARNR
jgi:tRNA-splicing ligase RtcB